jgi:hypothetical protein
VPHVGEIVAADGTGVGDPRYDRVTAQVVTDAHGRYAEAVARGRVFLASTQAGAAAGAGLSATVATISLTNPPGSGRRLDLLIAIAAATAAPAAAAAAFLAAFIPGPTTAITHTTPLTVRAALLGGPSVGPVGLADAAATLPAAPVIVCGLGGWSTGVGFDVGVFDVAGAVSVYPGSVITTQATAAVTAIWGYVWEEVPL